MTVIAIDAGGTNIKIGLIQQGQIIGRTALPAVSENGLEPRLPLILEKSKELLSQNEMNLNSVQGVGLSIPGIIDINSMKVLDINDKYNDIMNLDLPAWAKSAWGVPFVMEGDARSALVGSWKYGSGKGVNDLALITLGTGIGTAVIMDGKILYGKHFQAGILGGHFIVDFKGNKCNCGNVGCAEACASSWKLPSLIKTNPNYNSSGFNSVSKLDFETLFELAKNGDVCAMEIRNYCIDVWAAVVINIIHAYDPELVLIAGGVMKSADVILPAIRKRVDENAWTPWGKVKIEREKKMDDAALLGIAYLLKKKYKF
jgi:glucokinase